MPQTLISISGLIKPSRTGSEQFVNFSFRSVNFVRMELQFSSIPYSPTTGHGDRSVRFVGFDQKVHELFRPWFRTKDSSNILSAGAKPPQSQLQPRSQAENQPLRGLATVLLGHFL